MNVNDTIEEACERYLYWLYPEHTNMSDLREGGPVPFRPCANQEPIGFCYDRQSIEVHPKMVHDLIRLDIYLVMRGDGRLHLIQGDVIPEEHVV